MDIKIRIQNAMKIDIMQKKLDLLNNKINELKKNIRQRGDKHKIINELIDNLTKN